MRPDQPASMRSLLTSLQRLILHWLKVSVASAKSLYLTNLHQPKTRQITGLIFSAVVIAGLALASPYRQSSAPLDAELSTERTTESTLITNAASKPPEEIRGVWITNVASSVLFAPWGIPRTLHQLADMRFNTVYPVVWNRGKTFYHSKALKQITGQSIAPLMVLTHPSEDPLHEMMRVGHQKNMRVIPWFEYGFMVPLNARIAKEHPDWLTTRHDGSLRLHQKTEEAFVGDTPEKKTPKGLTHLLKSGAPRALGWLNPLHPGVQALMLDLVEEVVTQYDIDGIQFDDHFSLPVEFGYDPYTVALYQREHEGHSPPEDAADEDWIRWRAGKLSSFVKNLHARVKSNCPTCLISLSPNPAKFAYRFHLQDWRTWVENDWLDELVVQVYRDDLYRFEGELAKNTLQSAMDRIPVSIGILTGTWRRPISFEQIKEQVVSSRDHHFSGVSFFYWDTLWSYFTPESPQQRRRNFRELLSEFS